MATEKEELVNKLTGIYNFVFGLEELVTEKEQREQNLKQIRGVIRGKETGIKLSKGQLPITTIKGGVTIAGIIAILIFTNVGLIFKIVIAGLLVFLIYNIFLYRVLKSSISRDKKEIEECQKRLEEGTGKLNEMEGLFSDYFNKMQKEAEDAEQLFPGEYLPESRYVKHGIDMLNTGRADNFKDVLVRIDDFKFKENIEEKVKEQEQLVRKAAREATAAHRAAASAAASASSAASSASSAASSASSAASDASAARWRSS
jgi:hypothetical protein